MMDESTKLKVISMREKGDSYREISSVVGVPETTLRDFMNRRGVKNQNWWLGFEDGSLKDTSSVDGPAMLTIDIETAPLLGHVWGLFKQNLSLDMVQEDWYILSYCAKWMNEDSIIYEDKRDSYDNEDDTHLLDNIWSLLDKADIVIGQNSVRFDTKKINSRFVQNGFIPPSSYRHIDTLNIAKKHFNFTSNKLEYMTDKVNTKYRKLKHAKYPGYSLWKACLNGDMLAWKEMEEYNINDTLATEELYTKLRPWMSDHPNINTYHDREEVLCVCGANDWQHSGYYYTNLSKFDKFQCKACGAEVRGRVNLMSKEKRSSLRANTLK